MIFAILQCIALAVVGLLGILAFTGTFAEGAEATTIVIVFSVYIIAVFLFEIWTIIVAKRARLEILEETDPTNNTDIPKV
jgi:hypothetical protein